MCGCCSVMKCNMSASLKNKTKKHLHFAGCTHKVMIDTTHLHEGFLIPPTFMCFNAVGVYVIDVCRYIRSLM